MHVEVRESEILVCTEYFKKEKDETATHVFFAEFGKIKLFLVIKNLIEDFRANEYLLVSKKKIWTLD